MKRTLSILGISVLAASLAGGAGAAAAGLSEQALIGDGGKWMTELSVYAGNGMLGDAGGDYLASSFRMPQSIAVAADGSILVSDSRNQTIRKLSGGKAAVFAGVSLTKDNKGFPEGNFLDGTADSSFFNLPAGLAVDAQGAVYVADTGNHAVRKISPDGQVTTVAGDGLLGSADGKGRSARFNTPKDLAVAQDGTVYVADTLNHMIRKIAADGTVTSLNAPSDRVVEIFPGKVIPAGDYADGALKSAKFNEPAGLALDAKGNLYVSDTGNQRIRYIDLAAGKVTTVAGGGLTADGKLYAPNELNVQGDYADGPAAEARFDYPSGIAVTAEGGLLIADSMNHSVRYLLDGRVMTLAGRSDQFPGELDGIEGNGGLHAPTDVVELADGQILVADSFNNRIRTIGWSGMPEGLAADGTIHVVLNGEQIRFEAMPEYSNDRTMVPVRAIAEAAGYEVTYKQEGAAEFVGLAGADVKVEMAIGQAAVKRTETGKSTVEVQVDAAPYIKHDRTYVPLRFFAENLGMDVQWDEETSTAILRSRTFLKK